LTEISAAWFASLSDSRCELDRLARGQVLSPGDCNGGLQVFSKNLRVRP
jgi:hypothetical protein